MRLISLRNGAAISVRGHFEALAFHIPSALFIELADEAGEPRIDDLTTCCGRRGHRLRHRGPKPFHARLCRHRRHDAWQLAA